ncbi:MAG: hypothetical protein FI725_06945 [SAR202 cluster bacterium]|nr:hypothetical protein [SAR202 cluster bacterium]|tara:strand:+ start:265 stop:642 length:378 start_codon:yes stop_codon:yes gene_type:complete
MAKKHSLHIESGLRYDEAGLLFKLHIDLPEDRDDSQGAAIKVYAESLADGSKVAFNNSSSPALADFMAGYPRWMVRWGIQTTKSDDELNGTILANKSVEQLLDIAGLLGDMIDQKFSHHQESVLA